MPNIIPITDLQNYDELLKVLSDTEGGDPVFLTKEGRGSYVILDISEFEKLTATIRLMNELEKGERSAREEGLIDFLEIEKEFAKELEKEIEKGEQSAKEKGWINSDNAKRILGYGNV